MLNSMLRLVILQLFGKCTITEKKHFQSFIIIIICIFKFAGTQNKVENIEA